MLHVRRIAAAFWLAAAVAVSAQSPSNDLCGSAAPLSPGVPVAGTTVSAVANGPAACGSAFSPTFVDVFYSYVSAVDEACTLTLVSGTGVNRAAVFTGGCANPEPVSCLHGTSLFSTTTPCTWYAKAGVVYFIRLGKTALPGAFTVILTTATPVAGDDCSSAIALANGVNPAPPAGVSGAYFDSAGATTGYAPGVPCLAGGSFGAGAFDLWFTYVAPEEGVIAIGTCTPPGFAAGSQTDTSLEIFDGVCGAMIPFACDNDACDSPAFGAYATWRAAAGVTYWVRVSGFSGAVSGITSSAGRGTFYLTVTPPRPSLELSATATPSLVLTGGSAQIDVSVETSDGSPLGVVTMTADLSAFGGAPAAPFTPLGGGLFRLTTPLIAPTGEHAIPIVADNGSLAGSTSAPVTIYTLAHDFCAGALPITTGMNGAFTNADALPLNQAGFDSTACSRGGDPGGHDVYFLFSPPCDGAATISTCDGGMTTGPGELADTQLLIYEASACGGAGALLACNDDALGFGCGPAGLKSRVTFSAYAGVHYLVRVAGRGNDAGTFFLEVSVATAQLITIGSGCGTPFPATMIGSAPPYLGSTGTITVTAQPAASGFMLVSAPNLAASYTPIGACTLYLPAEAFGILDVIVTDAFGEWSLTGTFPDDPAFDCFALDVQAVIFGPAGLELTNALRLVMGY
jgi:hypothetical protein